MPMPDENWRSRLRPASFRGIAFHVDISGYIGGRRTVVHEYPKRDQPSTEDMGRRARRFAIAAYIVGGDYDLARDQLIAALEAGGPGTLVHPYLGEWQVQVEAPFNVTERRDRGRMCEIEVTFVEDGDAATTAPATNTKAQVASTADMASAANAASADAQLARSTGPRPALGQAGIGGA